MLCGLWELGCGWRRAMQRRGSWRMLTRGRGRTWWWVGVATAACPLHLVDCGGKAVACCREARWGMRTRGCGQDLEWVGCCALGSTEGESVAGAGPRSAGELADAHPGVWPDFLVAKCCSGTGLLAAAARSSALFLDGPPAPPLPSPQVPPSAMAHPTAPHLPSPPPPLPGTQGGAADCEPASGGPHTQGGLLSDRHEDAGRGGSGSAGGCPLGGRGGMQARRDAGKAQWGMYGLHCSAAAPPMDLCRHAERGLAAAPASMAAVELSGSCCWARPARWQCSLR